MCTVYYIGNHDPSIMKALGENPGVRSDSFSPSRPRLSSTISMAQTWGPQRAHELSGQGYDITMNFQCHHMSYTIIYHYHDTMYSHIPVALCFHFSLSISAKYVCMCIYIYGVITSPGEHPNPKKKAEIQWFQSNPSIWWVHTWESFSISQGWRKTSKWPLM